MRHARGLKISGHRIYRVRLCPWQWGYRIVDVDYRGWMTTDFQLYLGFIVVEGWRP